MISYKYGDCDCDSKSKVQVCSKGCELIQGNTADIKLKEDDCEVRVDVSVSKRKCVRVWGQIRDCHKKPVACALVKLLRIVRHVNGCCEYQGVAHTVTDCKGFYQFDICDCPENKNAKFRIIVSKPTIAEDRDIGNGEEICNPCSTHNDCCDDK